MNADVHTYTILLRLDQDSTRTILQARSALGPQPHHLMPPQVVMKGPFRACVPCGTLMQRMQFAVQDFEPVPLHLEQLRWLHGTELHWDASRTRDGKHNLQLLHLKTQLWTVMTSLVSIHCEFTPSESFGFRTSNPWQPGVVLAHKPADQTALVDVTTLVQPRLALGTVLDLYRLTLEGHTPVKWEHVAAFKSRSADSLVF